MAEASRSCLLTWLLVVICGIASTTGLHEAPNLSPLKTDSVRRYLYVIAVLDVDAANAYHNDPSTIQNAVSRVFYTVNTYFHQMNYIIVVSDIITTKESFPSIKQANEYHQVLRKDRQLPYHNVMVFFLKGESMRHGYSWTDQLCTLYNAIGVSLSIFNPEETAPNMMLQLSYLAGVKDSTPVPKCSCNSRSHHDQGECLRVPGLNQNCSLQALTDKLQNTTCLLRRPRGADDDEKDGLVQTKAPGSLGPLSLCGNGIVEAGEECDCGYGRYCFDNVRKKPCNPKTCLWEGSKQVSTDGGDSCTCTIDKQILGQFCGVKRCHLTMPIWILHGGIYGITAILLFFCCCCWTCCYGRRRNPEIIFSPPRSTFTLPTTSHSASLRNRIYHDAITPTLISSPFNGGENPIKPLKPPPPPPPKPKNKPPLQKVDSIGTLRPTIAPPPPPPVKVPKTTRAIFRQPRLDDQLPPPPSNLNAFRKSEHTYDQVPVDI